MKHTINDILKELYKIDNSLQNKEEDLKKAVAHLLTTRPNIKVDEKFKNELQDEIQQKILQKKVESFSKNKLTFFQILSYIFGTVGIACFWFIILRENVQISSKPIQIPMVEKKTAPNVLYNTESTPSDMLTGDMAPNSDSVMDESLKTRELSPVVWWEKQQNTLKKEISSPETQVSSDASQTESLPTEAPSQDDTSNAADMSMMADAVPEWWSVGLMKSSPMMAEYIQDVYIYSFTGEINLNFDTQYLTFKKLSPNNTYYTPKKLELENNIDNILKVALKWGKDGFIELPQSDKKREVHVVLKNPKVVYNNIYNFVWGTSIEYFGPSVIFEVASSDDPNFYQTEIQVPLIKEIYKYDENGKIIWLSQE